MYQLLRTNQLSFAVHQDYRELYVKVKNKKAHQLKREDDCNYKTIFLDPE
jgi:hypothetical protein